MSNFAPFNDISDFSFYKPGISEFGIHAILIFSDNGLPILSRYYTQNPKNNDQDFLIISAFISSLRHFIQAQNDDIFTDFGMGQIRYYIKIHGDKIYCLILSEIISRRITGESLTSLLELTLNQLIKSFTVYYQMTKTKDYLQLHYVDHFVFQIDTVLFLNFKNAINELTEINRDKKRQFDNFKVFYNNSDRYTEINHQLLIKGIQGLIIFENESNPLIVRDYALERETFNIDYYSGLSLATKKFAHYNLGVLTDIGLGNSRIMVKNKDGLVICLIISEVLYWRITGEILSIFMEMTISDILRSFNLYLDMFNYSKKGFLDDDTLQVFNEQIDLLLLENAKVALKELNN